MCLVTEQLEPIILEEDKIVYKAVELIITPSPDEYVMSAYQRFRYKLGKLYSAVIAHEPKSEKIYVRYYSDEQEIYYERKPSKTLVTISTGFHGFINLETAEYYLEEGLEVIVECTYPKGSEYYEDATGLCVSNQIIINKIIK
jgi:hypothetical protein